MKGYERVKEILESELSDYCYFEYGEVNLNNAYDQTKEDEYYEVEVKKGNGKLKTLYFHYTNASDIDKLEIDLNGEDTFYEVHDYDWTIKYFWMALLEW